SRAEGWNSGAARRSTKTPLRAAGSSGPNGRLTATAQPYRATGSVVIARSRASVTVVPEATPQGVACFTTAAEGAENSATIESAVSISRRLVNESPSPFTTVNGLGVSPAPVETAP